MYRTILTLFVCLSVSPAMAKHHIYKPHHRGHKTAQTKHEEKHFSVHGDRPYKLAGTVDVNGIRYHFVSGGSGWSIPYGDWKITPEAVGHWGERHGAIGLSDDTIHDSQLDKDRDGIEIHEATHFHTAGCFGILEKWKDFKDAVMAMVGTGEAWLHVSPHSAAITPSKVWVAPDEVTVTAAADDEPVVHHRKTHLAQHHYRRYAHHHYRHYAGA